MLGEPWIGPWLLVLYFYCRIILNCDVFLHSSQQRCSSHGICGLNLSPFDYAGVNSFNSYFPEYFLMAFMLNLSSSDFLRGSLYLLSPHLIWKSFFLVEYLWKFLLEFNLCWFYNWNNSITHYFKVSPHADCKGYHCKTSPP